MPDGDAADLLDLRMGDVIRMRRRHPCGGTDWSVVRIGADIGLRCQTCNRRILMERQMLRRRAQAFVERGPPLDPAIRQALFGDAAAPGRSTEKPGPANPPPAD